MMASLIPFASHHLIDIRPNQTFSIISSFSRIAFFVCTKEYYEVYKII